MNKRDFDSTQVSWKNRIQQNKKFGAFILIFICKLIFNEFSFKMFSPYRKLLKTFWPSSCWTLNIMSLANKNRTNKSQKVGRQMGKILVFFSTLDWLQYLFNRIFYFYQIWADEIINDVIYSKTLYLIPIFFFLFWWGEDGTWMMWDWSRKGTNGFKKKSLLIGMLTHQILN